MTRWLIPLLPALLLLAGCSYRYYADPLTPLNEAEQGENKSVADDGTVTHTQGRLEVGLRPMTDEELNRQFSSFSMDGADSRNPYTFGNSTYFRTGETPQRFTVFRATISNYQYPKVYLDPERVYITTSNGRKYYALTREQLWIYYHRYVGGGHGGGDPGMSGNAHHVWKERDGILRSTMFPDLPVFSAQEAEGYLVFRPLAPDVEELTVHIPGLVVRYDFRGDPAEMVDIAMRFEREIGRVYPDGSRVATSE
ncbi:MAG: hypothetical protein OXG13_17460 [Gemmatimonadaceae bacterium]|nr:hypothetical protein [Gemmatimonadaceae bacterium]